MLPLSIEKIIAPAYVKDDNTMRCDGITTKYVMGGGPVQIVFPGGLEECTHAAARRHNNHAVKLWLMIFSRYPEVL